MDTRVKPLDAGASVGTVVGAAAALGGPTSGSSGLVKTSELGRIRLDLPPETIDLAHARALELLGPGTITRDVVRAILLAAFPQPA